MNNDELTVTEAAALMGVTRQTISMWLKNGLGYRKQFTVKFIKRADLLAYQPRRVGKPKKEEK